MAVILNDIVTLKMKHTLAIIIISLTIIFVGCMGKVTVDKRPNLALPIYSESSCSTNPINYAIIDQGYEVRYFKFGFSTDIESMSAEITTNKTVKFSLGGLHSYSTNNIAIKLEDLLKISQLFREGCGTNDVILLDRH